MPQGRVGCGETTIATALPNSGWAVARLDFGPVQPRLAEQLLVTAGIFLAIILGGHIARHIDGPVEQLIAAAIGDASGKGLPAALFIADAQGAARACSLHTDEPATVLTNVNGLVARSAGESGLFITFFYALLDADSGRLRYAGAGHDPALLYHAATHAIEPLHSTGPPLGVMEDVNFTQSVATMAPGDFVLLYTDGVTEARNPADELFGGTRLRSLVLGCAHLSCADLVATVRDAALAFAAGGPQHDDITVLAARLEPEPRRGPSRAMPNA